MLGLIEKPDAGVSRWFFIPALSCLIAALLLISMSARACARARARACHREEAARGVCFSAQVRERVLAENPLRCGKMNGDALRGEERGGVRERGGEREEWGREEEGGRE